MQQWAKDETPGVDLRFETAQFVDYWASKAGKDATKIDWRRTWQTWMRRAHRDLPQEKAKAAAPAAPPRRNFTAELMAKQAATS